MVGAALPDFGFQRRTALASEAIRLETLVPAPFRTDVSKSWDQDSFAGGQPA